LSEITPDSNPNPAVNSTHKAAIGVDLAPITISPSRIFWRIECAIYVCVLIAASIALFPFFLTAFYWPILWLAFLLLIMFVLREAWRIQTLPAVTLSVQKQVWRLRNPAGEFTVAPFGEILLWAGVIVLHLKDITSGRKHTIIVLPDSVKADDWRRLRVWLRTGLRNNM